MSIETIAKIIFLVGLIAVETIRMPHRKRNQRERRANKIAASHVTPAQFAVDMTTFALTEILPLIYVFFGWPAAADYTLPTVVNGVAIIGGIAVFAVGLWVLFRAHADLGRNWSPTVEITQGQGLVTSGVYATVRHPIYAALLLFCLAQFLLLHNWLIGPAGLLGFLLVYFGRVPAEERMMIEHFGDEYRAYMDRVGGVLPRPRR